MCDFAGPADYFAHGTEEVRPPSFFAQHYRRARGLVWVRLSSHALVSERSGDLDSFVEAALPTIREPFVLVTTDGDSTVPDSLPDETVRHLLESPYLRGWYTQNYGSAGDTRIRPVPIGLDLHTRASYRSPGEQLETLRRTRQDPRSGRDGGLRVFCDLELKLNSPSRREAVAALRDCDHMVFQQRRTSRRRIWRRYARYPFILSAPGNGLDCHRTWEVLSLGRIVITRRSSLDPLYEGLPVVIVDDWEEADDRSNLERWWRDMSPLTDPGNIGRRLDMSRWLESARRTLSREGGQ